MYRTYRLIIILFAILLWGCGNNNTPIANRTVLVYMAADNNLYRNAIKDIKEMLQATVPANNNLLVYVDAPAASSDSIPKLFEIKNNKIKEICRYSKHNSASGEVLSMVLSDAMRLYPAIDFGLVLWSHGTGWLPQGRYDEIKANSPQYSFGLDNKQEMEIIELEKALPTKLKFIIFDACLMSNIETIYQLRHKADYIIASPTEILIAGFPYDKIVGLLFAHNIDYQAIAENYMKYYKQQTGVLQSATIAVVATKHLSELAHNIRSGINKDSILYLHQDAQKYEIGDNAVFYDLFDYLQQAETQNWGQYLKNIVKYNDFTPFFLSKLKIAKSYGISIFVHHGDTLSTEYKTLDWYTDTGLMLRK